VGKDDILYDLGCGDGRIVIAAAKSFKARGVGIDVVPERIRECKEMARGAGVENLVTFIQEDVFKVDISAATVVALYLLPDSNELLRPFLERQLKPGVRVISHNYPIAGWEKKRIDFQEIEDKEGDNHYIYLYRR
jgi:ubiquinone/menaquinone biosynthesis C-methylase UbiE